MEEEFNETEYYKIFNCTSDPSASEMFAYFEHNPGGLACLIIATVITAVQTVIMIDGVIWISKNIPHAERSTSMMWLYSIWPVFCIVFLCGLYIPKAALLSKAGANLFLFPTVYNYLALLVDYFGGEDAMIGKMKDDPVKYNKPPCCCCCPPKKCRGILKRRQYNVLELLVMQVAVVQPLLLFLSETFIIDGTFPMQDPFNYMAPGLYIQILTVISTLTAMQVLGSFSSAFAPRLTQYKYSTGPKFVIVQFALLMCNVQSTLINFIVGAVSCSNPYPYKSRDSMWNGFLVIIESLIFQPICIKNLRTLKGNVLFLPPQLKKSSTYAGSLVKAGGGSLLEKALEATDLNKATEKTPLSIRRSRSSSNLKEGYGSVITV
ncbi:organic solute transporter subunit alpha-like [Acanthaster planci]|uniref:Organic solute transporter subunit alpha-like n=1 Tax=Acanthaster planci TaxID=133434 RepID=A0A8B7ZIX8_ACAPL|nr:organic solute transporter subunit alpha-like [Acanthaster planci]